MPKRPSKRPSDLNSLAKLIVDTAVGKHPKGDLTPDGRDPGAVARGRVGVAQGGKARAEKLSRKRRTETAQAAAQRKRAKKT